MPAILKTTNILDPSSATTNIQLDSSGNVYLVPTSGNVGIGWTSPSSKLSISGGLDFKSYIAHADNFALYANSTDGTTLASYTGYPITFRVANSERMRIGPTGIVSIGTTSPYGGKFTVVGGGIQLSGGTSAQAGIRVQYASGVATISGINNDNNAFNPISFFTGASEAMRIDTAGNVGIGTGSPTTKLHVAVGSGTSIFGTTGGAAGYGGSFQNTDGGQAYFVRAAGATSNGILSAGNGASTYLFMDTSGNVGIGTTSSLQQLSVAASAPGSIVGLEIRNTDGPTTANNTTSLYLSATGGIANASRISAIYTGTPAVNHSQSMAFYTVNSGSLPAEAMRIDSSGNVGIGTSSPANKLDVQSSSSGAFSVNFQNTNSGSSAQARATFTSTSNTLIVGSTNNTSLGAGGFIYNASAVPLTFFTSASERMRIDSSGNVGIGTTSTLGNSLLNVSLGVVARNSGATNGYFQFYNENAGTDLKTWRVGNISSGALRFETVNDAYSAATERMRIDSSGNLLVGATSLIGSEKLSVTSGTTNATQYTTIATKGGSSFYIEQQQTTSVSTTATVILASPKYFTFCLVHGSDGTNRFSDVVLMSVGTGTVNVISSLSASGTPSARTYSQSSSTFRLAMASGTYTVQVTSLNMNS